MDAIGFALATAVLATAFTVFGVIDRLLVGLVSEIRYTIAPGIATGLRAWGDGSGDAGEVGPADADDQASGGSASARRSVEPGPPVPTMPVRRAPRHTWVRFARLPRAPASVGH